MKNARLGGSVDRLRSDRKTSRPICQIPNNNTCMFLQPSVLINITVLWGRNRRLPNCLFIIKSLRGAVLYNSIMKCRELLNKRSEFKLAGLFKTVSA